MKNENTQLQSQNTTLNQQLEKTKQMHSDCQRELEEKIDQLRELQGEIGDLRDQNRELKKSLEESCNDCEQLASENQRQQILLTQQKQDHDETITKLNQLQELH